jgi:hypothetical protein
LADETTVRQFQQLRIISKGTVMSVENYAAPSNPTLPGRGYEILRVVLGIILLVTSALKAQAMFASTSSPDVFFSSPRLQIATIEIESALGLWLLSGLAVRLAWACAAVFFALLASVSLWMAVDGQADCGCLGAVHANPLWTFGFDVAAVVALCAFRPKRIPELAPQSYLVGMAFRVAGGAVVILLMIVGLFVLLADDPTDTLARLRGEGLTISPSVADVGVGGAREIHDVTYQLRNHTDHEIRVIGSKADCRCMTTRDLPITIPPRETRVIGIGAKFGGTPGSFQHEFVLYIDDREQGVVVGRFIGRVVEPLTKLVRP